MMKKQNNLIIRGRINQEGKLELNREIIRLFLENQKGKEVIFTLDTYTPNRSQSMEGYYFKYIIPKFQRVMYENGEDFTKEQMDHYLRLLSPVMRKESANENGEWEVDYKSLTDISNQDFVEYIEFLKRYAAKNYQLILED